MTSENLWEVRGWLNMKNRSHYFKGHDNTSLCGGVFISLEHRKSLTPFSERLICMNCRTSAAKRKIDTSPSPEEDAPVKETPEGEDLQISVETPKESDIRLSEVVSKYAKILDDIYTHRTRGVFTHEGVLFSMLRDLGALDF